MSVQIDANLFEKAQTLIAESNAEKLIKLFEQEHPADIAEVINELPNEEAVYLIKLLKSEKTADILTEVHEDTRDSILDKLTSHEIAAEINELDTDDAVDIIATLSDLKKREVIAYVEDSHAKQIIDLLRYAEDTAGGLMGKELIKVNENWTVLTCVKKMREQAENVQPIHTIYVVNDDNVLKGRLSLKYLLTTSTKTKIKDIFIKNVDTVNVFDKAEEVARVVQKYDLVAVPVIDELGRLLGRITIDDIVDIIKEEAEKDYQLAAGLLDDVAANDTVLATTRARLPWLFLGMLGGLGAAYIMGMFEEALESHIVLFMFTPLIAAMAGNVGVQSSAIIVQGLANDNLKGSISNRLTKELLLAFISGLLLSIILFGFTWIWYKDVTTAITLALSLLVVIVVSGLIGTFIPLVLHKRGIDPAIATGPFITTSNDIFGILIYFWIAKMLLGF